VRKNKATLLCSEASWFALLWPKRLALEIGVHWQSWPGHPGLLLSNKYPVPLKLQLRLHLEAGAS
jgi:hypothetical protein